MNNTKLKEIILEVLKADKRLWDSEEKELNQTLLLDLVEKIDENIINLLLQKKELRDKFFIKIKDVYVFKTNDFRFFMEENKVDNSYTSYERRIGLSDGKQFISNNNLVVLNFPYKDCVLEGGQNTEEGVDTYFEYSDKTGKYQQKQSKRKEIFFNEILAKDEIDRLFDPKAFKNWKRFTKNGEEEVKDIKRNEDGIIKENLIIKGNNLLTLHSLKKQFAGKIKLIYIDPPYNTGNDDFKYNDNFNHSTWLTFMKNRLEVAKELLKDDGVIFVQIDDNEKVYLNVLLDEIFKKINHEVTFYIQVRYESKTLSEKKDYHPLIEQILVYKKDSFHPVRDREPYVMDSFGWKIIELEKGEEIKLGKHKAEVFKIGQYQIKWTEPNLKGLKEVWASGTVLKANASGKFFENFISNRIKVDGFGCLYKVYGIGEDGLGYRYFTGPKKQGFTKGKFYSGIPLKRIEELKNGNAVRFKGIPNFYNFADAFGNCRNEGGVELRSGKKPEILLKRIIEISTKEGDIVLDFFAGTGTTCAVAHKMKRQYIGIEQLDYNKNDVTIRLKNVIGKESSKGKLKKSIEDYDTTGISSIVNWGGGGDFIYCELAKWNETAKEKILKAKSLDELEKLFDELYYKYFLNYNLKIKEFKEKVILEKEFRELSLDEQKKIFLTMLDLNQMYVQKTEMADEKFGIKKEDQNLTLKFYGDD